MPGYVLFGKEISSYWTMCAIGMLLVVVFSMLRVVRYQFPVWKGLLLAVSINITGIAGVFLLGYVQSGFRSFSTSFMGALLFTPLMMALSACLIRVSVGKTVGFCAVPICAMAMCMKIGCFLAGCCEGILLEGGRVPIQLIESGVSLLILIALLIVEIRCSDLSILFPLYMMLYAGTRFPLEYFRNSEKFFMQMSMGQVTALLVFTAGTGILIVWNIKHKKRVL